MWVLLTWLTPHSANGSITIIDFLSLLMNCFGFCWGRWRATKRRQMGDDWLKRDTNSVCFQCLQGDCKHSSQWCPHWQKKTYNQYQKSRNIRLHADDVFIHDLYQNIIWSNLYFYPLYNPLLSTIQHSNKKMAMSMTISVLFIYRCWILRTLKKQIPLCKGVKAAMKSALPSSRVHDVEGKSTRSFKLQENLFPYPLK